MLVVEVTGSAAAGASAAFISTSWIFVQIVVPGMQRICSCTITVSWTIRSGPSGYLRLVPEHDGGRRRRQGFGSRLGSLGGGRGRGRRRGRSGRRRAHEDELDLRADRRSRDALDLRL